MHPMPWWQLLILSIGLGVLSGICAWLGWTLGYRRGNDDGFERGYDTAHELNRQARESFIETMHDASR